jgi:acyl-CoA-binding protein
MSLQDDFDRAVISSRELKEKPANEDLLKLYAFYKQASTGDVSGNRPGGFDFKGAAKYDAWAALRGTSKEKAMTDYINLVNRLHGA